MAEDILKMGKEGPKRIIIAGGGTGGHIFPAIAIAKALIKIDDRIEILFIGAKGKMEMEKVPQAGFNIKGIDIAGYNRSSLIKNFSLPFKLVKSFLQVGKLVRAFKPDAVVGVGGYSSFPVLRYAQSRHIPVFIHESNAFAGKSNRLLGKKATKIFVASEGMEKFFPPEKILKTGNPVRENISSMDVGRKEAATFFGLDPSVKTVFVTGGSLGAKGINEAVAEKVDEFEKNNLQLIWQTGKPFAEKAKNLCEGKKGIWTADFINRMDLAYAACDLVISRSGAMSVAELCMVKKPVVFVPYPFAAEDHQTANAENMVKQEAGLMVKDNEAKEKLVATAIGLLKDDVLQKKLVKHISALAVADADKRIAGEILKSIG